MVAGPTAEGYNKASPRQSGAIKSKTLQSKGPSAEGCPRQRVAPQKGRAGGTGKMAEN